MIYTDLQTYSTKRPSPILWIKTLFVRWDGEIAPYCRFLHTVKEYVFKIKKRIYAYIFGNINKEYIYDIWNKRDYKWFRFIVENSIYSSYIDCVFNESCDFIKDTEIDCWGGLPSCANCLWLRNIIIYL